MRSRARRFRGGCNERAANAADQGRGRIHAGESTPSEDGYVGLAVNTAARICAEAHAGEVLVSETVRSIARTGHDFTFTLRGRRHLKGISEPITIYSVARKGAVLSAGEAVSGERGVGAESNRDGVIVYSATYKDRNGASWCERSPEEARLMLIDPDGSQPVRVTHGMDLFEREPAWSPDGSTIAFIGDSEFEGSFIYLIAPDGTGIRRVTVEPETPDTVYAHPTWSFDGRQLAFSKDDSVWVATPDGSGAKVLPPRVEPAWSPDGRRVAFTSLRDGHPEIYVVGVDGTGETRLTNTAADVANCSPSWQKTTAMFGQSSPSSSGFALRPFERGRLQPGVYLDDTFKPAIQFQVDAGWEAWRTNADLLSLAIVQNNNDLGQVSAEKVQVVYAGPCEDDSQTRVIGASPRDLIDALRTNRNLETSVPLPVNLGGVTGLRTDISPKTLCSASDPRLFLFRVGQNWQWLQKDDEMRVFALDVRGTTLTVIVGGSAAEFEQSLALAAPVLDRLRFP